MQEGVSLLRERLGSIEFLEERVHLFVLVGEVCLGYSRARYRRPGPGFDPAHPRFSIGIAWIGGTVESAYTIYSVHYSMYTGGLYLEQKMRRKLSSHFAQVLLYITNR